MSDSTERTRVLRAFADQLERDLEASEVRPLGEYLQRFPGHDLDIAREMLRRLQRGRDEGDHPTVGPYAAIEELGRGGQGVVFRARHEELGHEVALKLLKNLGPGSDQMLDRFYREARVAARLNHPGICQVVDAGVEGGVPFMAMQLIEGESLDERLRRARQEENADEETQIVDLSSDATAEPGNDESSSTSSSVDRREIDAVLELFERICLALDAAHESGVIHRDLKPGNVMVRPDGQPVILDFGLAHSEDADLQTLTASGDLFGTPAYMSPEQLAAHRIRVDARTDIWSIGVALFECLTLQRPFAGPSREALYQAIMTREAPDIRKLNPRISKDLAVVVAKSLEKDRERRYGTAGDLADDLRSARKREPVRARPVSTGRRVRHWVMRNRVVAASLATIILVTSTAAVLATHQARVTEEKNQELLDALALAGSEERKRLVAQNFTESVQLALGFMGRTARTQIEGYTDFAWRVLSGLNEEQLQDLRSLVKHIARSDLGDQFAQTRDSLLIDARELLYIARDVATRLDDLPSVPLEGALTANEERLALEVSTIIRDAVQALYGSTGEARKSRLRELTQQLLGYSNEDLASAAAGIQKISLQMGLADIETFQRDIKMTAQDLVVFLDRAVDLIFR